MLPNKIVYGGFEKKPVECSYVFSEMVCIDTRNGLCYTQALCFS